MLMNEYMKNNEYKSGYIILKLYSNYIGYFKISNKIVVFDSEETAYYYIILSVNVDQIWSKMWGKTHFCFVA